MSNERDRQILLSKMSATIMSGYVSNRCYSPYRDEANCIKNSVIIASKIFDYVIDLLEDQR